MIPGKSVSLPASQATLWRRGQLLAASLVSWGAQLYKYTLVGAAVFLIDIVTYWLLISLCDSWFLYAHFVSRTVGGIACFVLNRYVTFNRTKREGLWGDLARFAALYGVSFVLASVLVFAAVDLASMHPVTGKFVAECTVFLFNYSVMKYWVLRRKDD